MKSPRHVRLARSRGENIETYGSARWATPVEIRDAGLLGPDGVVLGKLDREYLRHYGPVGVLCFAPAAIAHGHDNLALA